MFRRYNRHDLKLDAFCFASVIAVVIYMVWHDSLKSVFGMEDAQDSMLANLISELAGIAISVRLIDIIIRKKDQRDRIRVRVVRNIRFVERLVTTLSQHLKAADLYVLKRELAWVDGILPKRQKHLSSDEIEDVNVFFHLVKDFLDLIDENARGVSFVDPGKAAALANDVFQARKKAEDNILEETDEDAGLA